MWNEEEKFTLWYRSPTEIRSDMNEVSEQIRRINERLNVRDLIVDSVYESNRDPERTIRRLEILVGQAKESLSELEKLEEKLMMLQEELEEVRAAGCRC